MLRPGRGNEWVIPDVVDVDACDDHSDFLSVPSGCWRRSGDGATAAMAASAASAAVEGSQRVIRGAAPSAAVCSSEAVKNNTPSAGLRVVLEIVRPEVRERWGGAAAGGGGAASPGGANGERALYHAIAVLVAANARSPSTRPVVVLTDLECVWKLLWLGGSRSAAARREGADRTTAGRQAAEASTPAAANRSDLDVFVWRLKPADAASVVRSMLLEETADWDGEVSWPPQRAARYGWHDVHVGGGGGGEDDGPMAALRNRHLVGRRRRFDGGDHSADVGGGGVGQSAPIVRAPSPPVAMEMALRLGGAASFTGQSLPGQTFPVADAGEREVRSFSCAAGEREVRSFSCAAGLGGGGGRGGVGNMGLASSSTHHGGSTEMSFHGAFHDAFHGNANGHVAAPLSNELMPGSTFDSNGGGGTTVGGRGGVRPSPPASPLAGGEPTVLRHLISFASGDGFLFVAGVSRSWRDAWGVERPPETNIDAAVQSPSRLGWSRASGCRWGSNVCARAAAGGYLATLRYARAIGCPWDWRTCAHAATEVRCVLFFCAFVGFHFVVCLSCAVFFLAARRGEGEIEDLFCDGRCSAGMLYFFTVIC